LTGPSRKEQENNYISEQTFTALVTMLA